MNLLFAVNRRFIPLLLNCAASIVKNGGAEQYDAYILQSDFTEEDQHTVQTETGERMICHFVSVPETLFEGFPESKRYPKQIYYRLAAPMLLPQELERILYLDVDTVVINPLSELYETELEGKCCAACTHVEGPLVYFNQLRLNTEKHVPYINTGVLMMNLTVMREVVDMDEICRYANEYQYTLMLPDQDIFTALYGKYVKLVDTMRYNLSDQTLLTYNATHPNDVRDVNWVREHAVIIHYYGKNKPWKPHYIGKLDVFYQEHQQSEQEVI